MENSISRPAVASNGVESAGKAKPRSRGRPRNPANDAAILNAARDILATHGFDALTFEAVAQAAGISRVSIYRRWPSKAHLVNEIANRGNEQFPDVIEEQGLEGEVRAVLALLHGRYSQRISARRPSAHWSPGSAILRCAASWKASTRTRPAPHSAGRSKRARRWARCAPRSTAMRCST